MCVCVCVCAHSALLVRPCCVHWVYFWASDCVSMAADASQRKALRYQQTLVSLSVLLSVLFSRRLSVCLDLRCRAGLALVPCSRRVCVYGARRALEPGDSSSRNLSPHGWVLHSFGLFFVVFQWNALSQTMCSFFDTFEEPRDLSVAAILH